RIRGSVTGEENRSEIFEKFAQGTSRSKHATKPGKLGNMVSLTWARHCFVCEDNTAVPSDCRCQGGESPYDSPPVSRRSTAGPREVPRAAEVRPRRGDAEPRTSPPPPLPASSRGPDGLAAGHGFAGGTQWLRLDRDPRSASLRQHFAGIPIQYHATSRRGACARPGWRGTRQETSRMGDHVLPRCCPEGVAVRPERGILATA